VIAGGARARTAPRARAFAERGALALAGALLVGLATSPSARAQDGRVDELPAGVTSPDRPAESHDPVTPAELHEHVAYLASDELEGREAGTPGERLAAAYFIERLEALPFVQPGGLDGAWLQPFETMGIARLGVANNVLAILPGSDPDLAHEVIVLGAHYDHVGHGKHGNSLAALGGDLEHDSIHNGADDNASGSAVLLELAESLATAPVRPRRTVMFQWYSGEEVGLLGSLHWVKEPTLDFDRVVAMLNMDMVGRLTGSTLMVGGVGTTPAFEGLVRAAADAEKVDLILDQVGAAPSDNASFHQADVPVLFFFTGLHRDYHQPSDEIDGFNSVGASRVARMIESVLRGLDAIDERPPFVAVPGEPFLFAQKVYLGLALLDVPVWVPGSAIVSVVVPDGPAGIAGLEQGDVILRIDGERPRTRQDAEASLALVDALRTPRVLQVWRRTTSESVTEDDDWLETHELVDVPIKPVVR
jgi:hypothetical protein